MATLSEIINQEHMITTVEVSADMVAYQGYHNKKKYMNVATGVEGGDCLSSSFGTWVKLRKIGAVRVRGKRMLEQLQEIGGRQGSWHYWVEAKGMVYDLSSGATLLMTTENYYKAAQIIDVQKAEYVGLFDCELYGCTEQEKRTTARRINDLTYPKVYFDDMQQALEDECTRI